MLAISERVVIRADDLLNWCDDTINWSYGLRANTLLNPTIKKELSEINDKQSETKAIESAPAEATQSDSDPCSDQITSNNVRSLKNSKLDFTEVEKEKGNNTLFFMLHFLFTFHNFFLLNHSITKPY